VCDNHPMTHLEAPPEPWPPGSSATRSRTPLGRLAARLLLQRIAGPDAAAVRQRIHGTPGPRWFPRNGPVVRVHADASMFIGGITALLVQSLHPGAMSAVADHSGYRSDPWGRLQRTATFIATTSFAPAPMAERTCAAVRAVHARIDGTTPAGTPYAASDPHLLRWVHVAEAWSFLEAHQRYGRRPLTRAEEDAYVDGAARVAEELGATDVPHSRTALDQCLEGYREELDAIPAALDTVDFLLQSPPIPAIGRPAYALISRASVDLAPAWVRDMLQLPHPSPGAAHRGGRLATRVIRWALDSAPPPRREGTESPSQSQ